MPPVSLLLILLAASELAIVDTVVDVVKTATEPFSPFIVFSHSIRSKNVVHAWLFWSTRFTTWQMNLFGILVRFFSLYFSLILSILLLICCRQMFVKIVHSHLIEVDCLYTRPLSILNVRHKKTKMKHFHFLKSPNYDVICRMEITSKNQKHNDLIEIDRMEF